MASEIHGKASFFIGQKSTYVFLLLLLLAGLTSAARSSLSSAARRRRDAPTRDSLAFPEDMQALSIQIMPRFHLVPLAAGHSHSGYKNLGFHNNGRYKGSKGYKDSHGYNKKHHGDFGRSKYSGHFDKGGKKYKGVDHRQKYFGDYKKGKTGKKGNIYGNKGYHNKGHKDKGFKNVYHKEEYQHSKKYYDDFDNKKYHHKYNHKDAFYKGLKGKDYKGGRYKSLQKKPLMENETAVSARRKRTFPVVPRTTRQAGLVRGLFKGDVITGRKFSKFANRPDKGRNESHFDKLSFPASGLSPLGPRRGVGENEEEFREEGVSGKDAVQTSEGNFPEALPVPSRKLMWAEGVEDGVERGLEGPLSQEAGEGSRGLQERRRRSGENVNDDVTGDTFEVEKRLSMREAILEEERMRKRRLEMGERMEIMKGEKPQRQVTPVKAANAFYEKVLESARRHKLNSGHIEEKARMRNGHGKRRRRARRTVRGGTVTGDRLVPDMTTSEWRDVSGRGGGADEATEEIIMGRHKGRRRRSRKMASPRTMLIKEIKSIREKATKKKHEMKERADEQHLMTAVNRRLRKILRERRQRSRSNEEGRKIKKLKDTSDKGGKIEDLIKERRLDAEREKRALIRRKRNLEGVRIQWSHRNGNPQSEGKIMQKLDPGEGNLRNYDRRRPGGINFVTAEKTGKSVMQRRRRGFRTGERGGNKGLDGLIMKSSVRGKAETAPRPGLNEGRLSRKADLRERRELRRKTRRLKDAKAEGSLKDAVKFSDGTENRTAGVRQRHPRGITGINLIKDVSYPFQDLNPAQNQGRRKVPSEKAGRVILKRNGLQRKVENEMPKIAKPEEDISRKEELMRGRIKKSQRRRRRRAGEKDSCLRPFCRIDFRGFHQTLSRPDPPGEPPDPGLRTCEKEQDPPSCRNLPQSNKGQRDDRLKDDRLSDDFSSRSFEGCIEASREACFQNSFQEWYCQRQEVSHERPSGSPCPFI